MRPRTQRYWVDWVRTLYASGEKQARIAEILLTERPSLVQQGVTVESPPGYRTVRRICDAFGDLPLEEQLLYERFFWPQTMELNILPWDASAYALELVSEYQQRIGGRPLIRVVRWFHRVSLAAPDLILDRRVDVAGALAINETMGWPSPEIRTRLERWLAFGPWRGKKHVALYEAALKKQGDSGIFTAPTVPPAQLSLPPARLPEHAMLHILYFGGSGDWAKRAETSARSFIHEQERSNG